MNGKRLGGGKQSRESPRNSSMLTFPFSDYLSQFRTDWGSKPHDPTQEKKSILPLKVISVNQGSSVSSGPAQQSGSKVFSSYFPPGLKKNKEETRTEKSRWSFQATPSPPSILSTLKSGNQNGKRQNQREHSPSLWVQEHGETFAEVAGLPFTPSSG